MAKVDSGGTSLVYAGFIGGSGGEIGYGIAVDGPGNAFVTGFTDSTESTFPVSGSLDLSANDGNDAFVAKVASNGISLISSGFIGGSGVDFGNGIAVDGSGNAYVTGHTNSTESSFPKTAGPDLTANGGLDAFVTKIGVTAQCGDGVVEGSEACDIGSGAADTCANGSVCVAAGGTDECTCRSVSTTPEGTTGGTTGGATGVGPATGGGTPPGGDAPSSGGCGLTLQF